MVDISTYKNEVYELYELYHDVQTTASGTALTVSTKRPHADVIADVAVPAEVHMLERTRVYINGARATVSKVVDADPNTTITISPAADTGDTVGIFLAARTGTLANNQSLGKFPLVELQTMQDYGATSNTFKQPGCGTERTEAMSFAADGDITLGLNRRGNTNMENFIAARSGKVYLMIIVKDTTVPASPTYDVLHEARVSSYGRATRALDAEGGKVTDTITFSFVPDVAVST